MMQGLHHQQQQLATLLSAALPKAAAAANKTDSSSSNSSSSDGDESSRLSAINSLHHAILYPPNSLLVTHSASFLAHGFSQLVSDKSYSVRRSAATAYGALCSMACSMLTPSNGRQNQVILGSVVDRFIGWALPLISNVNTGDGKTELALEALREFLNVVEVGASERYALPILKACQELLEDERTSLRLLPQILGVLTLISLKFFRCFQPHFVDIVDLLLGWAMVPDLSESDRRVIMDSFLQFQKHWVNSLQFSLGLLSKFLGDMDVLLQDGSLGTPQQFQRLLALLSCFCTVLQSTASGLLEMNFLEQIIDPLSTMVPLLLGCVSMVGAKFGWSKWIQDSWRCLTLLAEIIGERFSTFYPLAVDLLFQSLGMGDLNQQQKGHITSMQVHGVLKTNLQLLSLQKHGLLPSSVFKLLQFDSAISQLRLHPNHLVTGSSAATYIFLLQHGNNEVVKQAVTCITEELELLKGMLERDQLNRHDINSVANPKTYSKIELVALIKFDLKVLLSCISVGGDKSVVTSDELSSLFLNRSIEVSSFIVERLHPFDFPIQGSPVVQSTVISTLHHLTMFEFRTKCSVRKKISRGPVRETSVQKNLVKDGLPSLIFEYMQKYSILIVKALQVSSPLVVKLEAFVWIYKLCQTVIDTYENAISADYPCESFGYAGVVGKLVSSVLHATSDREPTVRSHVASALEMLLQAKLVHPTHFYAISEVVLEKLGDPISDVKDAFVRILSHVLPITIYACGLYDCGAGNTYQLGISGSDDRSSLHWRQVFALKQLPRQLHSQQLVSILSFISQRWKVPLSNWIQRLVHTCRSSLSSSQQVEIGNSCVDDLGFDIKVEDDILERISSVNILAGAWWAINEAARYCITTRLRTNLGGPTQTFAALERMLLDIAHVLQLDTDQTDGNLNILGSSYAHLLPMRLLLDFVEALKKNVYNAYDGSTVLPCASRQSSLFFRANRKVCEEWFSRICEPMMNAGLALQCHQATIHYCTLRMQELKNLVTSALKDKSRHQVPENLHHIRDKYSENVLRVLRHMALALCKSHESEALIGLQKWVTMTFYSLFTDGDHTLGDSDDHGPFSWISGLVYQSDGRYEKAAAHFTHLLELDESLSYMGSEGVQFSIARIIECYSAVADWKSLDSWLLDLQTLRAKHAGKSFSGALTTAGNEINSIHALARFDEGDFQAASACLDLTPKSSNELTLDPKLALQRSEQMLLQAMLFQIGGKVDEVSHELQKAKSMLEEAFSILPLDGLDEAAAYATQLHCIVAFEENCKSRGRSDKLQSLLSSYVQVLKSPMNQVHQDCNMWVKVMRVYQKIHPASPVTLKLSKNVLSLARKQRNLLLANRLNTYVRDLTVNFSDGKYGEIVKTSLHYESILLMHAENRFEDALDNLWSFLRPSLASSAPTISDPDQNALKAKAWLKLSDWLKRDYLNVNSEDIVLKMVADLKVTDVSPLDNGVSCPDDGSSKANSNAVLIVEELVGTALKFSCQLCPSLAKSWVSYASWCYNQAKASMSAPSETVLYSCSFSSIIAAEVQPNRFNLTEEELLKVESIVSHLVQTTSDAESLDEEGRAKNYELESSGSVNNENCAKTLVQHVRNIMEVAAGVPGAESSRGECLSVTLTSQLQKLFRSANAGLEESNIVSSVNRLVDIWWSLRKRRVSLFGHAAVAFSNYLSYSSSTCGDRQLAGSTGEYFNQKTATYSLQATLYVLNILLNFGVELKETLEPALSAAPLFPWQEVTPQLFARLSSHPEKVVRKLLEGLLVRLAKLSPWSIVYPTLVDVNACEREPSEELQQILSCLSELHPRLIQDVQLVIKELENITVLWEEQWLSTLQDLHSDVMRRINLLKEEAARISENATLSHSEKNKINAAKYSAMMAPIVVALERRLATTSRKPETPHEIWFQEEYNEQIKSAILNFKTAPASATALGDVWRPFDNIAASLTSHQKKLSIPLGEVAPQLAQLSSFNVPMPGLEKQIALSESDGGLMAPLGIVRIASFTQQVAVLSTKTKPKKIVILGSDGHKYTYLLKGREDLRLDARIMQLLQATNGFLHSSRATRGRSLSIRYYSVTPISGRAGLIQWVDNVTSIYSIFKSWQNRVQLAQLQALNAGNMKNSVPPPVPRPSDMFYGKIIPALKEKGIRRVISRKDWPHEVKQKVLLDLMNEVPKQLLHQELWCASEGFRAFSSKLRRYSGSVAAMSMVGHILGLGDRHLDNILIDFSSGDILHIDYNVCFDKGQRLKIPEIVPFRLTQTIEAALGLTGTEGTFRANCEAVLGVLRKNKDVILMLLEVFVWDPLVEWTREDFHDDAAIVGEERKGMELAVSLSLFASRVQEIRVALQEHHDLLLGTLPAVDAVLEGFVSVLKQYELVSALFYHADQERTNLALHETSARSIVSEATSCLERIRASLETQAKDVAQAKAVVDERAQEATSWIDQHGRILDALRSGSINELKAHMQDTVAKEALSLTSAVLVAAVPLTIVPEPTQVQCHDIDRDVSQLVAELDHGLFSAATALQTYSLALQKVLPLNYLTTSPVHGWAQILQFSANSIAPDVLSVARRNATELIAKVHRDGFDLNRSKYDDLCSKVEKYAEKIEKFEKEGAELMNSIGLETESRAKDRLLSAFTKYLHSAGVAGKEDAASDGKKGKVLFVLNRAVTGLYDEVKHRLLNILSRSASTGDNSTGNALQSDTVSMFCEFEEQIEKCVLVAGFVDELQQYAFGDSPGVDKDNDHLNYFLPSNWASLFRNSLLSCKNLVGEMTKAVLPEVLRSVVSFNSDIMDAFGSLSQIRGSIDTKLKQLIEVELEKASLVELEQDYFVKVGQITEQQLALEEASVKGRDVLSWEEAEELASQEEACRMQLDKLHQMWNQKDTRTSALMKREASIRSALHADESHFQSLVTCDEKSELQIFGSSSLLATVVQPFSELESIDRSLVTLGEAASTDSSLISQLATLMSSGCPVSEYIWKLPTLMNDHSFFVWKINILDSLIDSCMHDATSSAYQTLGFSQLLHVIEKKLEIQLQEHVGRYLKDRVIPFLLARLEKHNEISSLLTDRAKEFGSDQVKKDSAAVRRVQVMLEEYCSAHETVRAAKSAASLMERQVNELKGALQMTCTEIIQMEWMNDVPFNPLHNVRLISNKFLASEDDLISDILNLSRPQLLERIQSAASEIVRSVEGLQVCERTSATAEGQLERAMGWACGGPNSGGTGNTLAKNSGIPPEFHNHLIRRRQLLWEAREKASDMIKLCIPVLEFEASRDGILRTSGELYPFRSGADGRAWQQDYLNTLTRLDVSYHSFTRTEQEWKLTQTNLELVSNGLLAATNELHIASLKAKSASEDMQKTLVSMRDCAYETSMVLSSFGHIIRGHTALTSECGSMLEEVLAITEGLHDVHSLGREAAAVHSSLMKDLSKASTILLPLESVLSKDVEAMTEAMEKEKETKMEISPIHGQAIYQSYNSRIKEANQAVKPLVPSLTISVKGLHSMLTRLARSASLHAGNLHKALEGLGESQEASQDIKLSRPVVVGQDSDCDSKEEDVYSGSDAECGEDSRDVGRLSLQDNGWISPPDSICSSSSSSAESVITSEASLADSLNNESEVEQLVHDLSSADPKDSLTSVTLSGDDAGSAGGSSIYDESTHKVTLTSHTTVPSIPLVKHGPKDGKVEEDEEREAPLLTTNVGNRVTKGKNAYALSVLKRVEMKLDGRDVAADNRPVSTAEQVDYLLKQATSLDNLCNMYEGWTPWI